MNRDYEYMSEAIG